MNVNKNKSISKGFIFSKTISPTVGALLLATQMTGCTGMSGRLGLGEDSSNCSRKTTSSDEWIKGILNPQYQPIENTNEKKHSSILNKKHNNKLNTRDNRNHDASNTQSKQLNSDTPIVSPPCKSNHPKNKATKQMNNKKAPNANNLFISTNIFNDRTTQPTKGNKQTTMQKIRNKINLKSSNNEYYF
ncbi:MAG: hypothetical protein NMK33_04120 [Candidatus Cardinium sp.]|nr:MAG: hypothetical protein NMK33_04120 [Candidatus Cardinium sp.]